MNNYDNYKPSGSWQFDDGVTDVFQNMLSRSIPCYQSMRDIMARLAAVPLDNGLSNRALLDIGCSQGLMIGQILDRVKRWRHVQVTGIDNSAPMIQAAETAFEEYDNVNFVLADISNVTIAPGRYTVITSILTAQFVPLDERQEMYRNILNGLDLDGRFLLVEKVLGETPTSNKMLVDSYYDMKRDNGYSDEQIEEKRKALQGVLVPLRASENEAMLKDVGFHNVQRVWQCFNFAGWMATR